MGLLEAGSEAPDFQVKDHTGKDVKLSNLRGKTVVLWFYPKADTPGWTAEGRGFRELISEYQEKNVQILGASFDTIDANAAFAKKFDFPFPLLCDTDRDIGMKYGACDSASAGSAKRITYVIDPEGKISQVYGKVNAADHPKELLATL